MPHRKIFNLDAILHQKQLIFMLFRAQEWLYVAAKGGILATVISYISLAAAWIV